MENDGGYASKVMAEHARLLAVVGGKPLPQPVRAIRVKQTPVDDEVKSIEKVAGLIS